MSDLRYEKPNTLEQAARLLAEYGQKARILAGGTDLLVAHKNPGAQAELMLDIKGIPELGVLGQAAGGGLEIGAGVPVGKVADDPVILRDYTALAVGAGHIGSVQIRNRATIGGNLCNASACMDVGPGLLVLDATLRLFSTRGFRELPLREFFKGYKTLDKAADELLVSIVVKRPPAGYRSGFEKLKRVKGHDLSVVNAAAGFDPVSKILRTAIGSCSAVPMLLPELKLEGAVAEAREALVTLVLKHICPIDDVRSCSEYRRDMAALFARRLVDRLLASKNAA